MSRWRAWVATVGALSFLLVGCGSPSGTETTGQPEAVERSGEARCGAVRFDVAGYEQLPAATTLDDQVLRVLSDEMGDPTAGGPFKPADGWKVVTENSDTVEVLQQLDEAERAVSDGATHRVAMLQRSDGITGVADGTWLPDVMGTCQARRAEGYDTQPELALSQTPSPQDTVLVLLVRERTCASGRDADGRIRVDQVAISEADVRLRLSVEPLRGEQDCRGSPPTPFELDLGEPLGDREVVDANLVPPVALEVDGG